MPIEEISESLVIGEEDITEKLLDSLVELGKAGATFDQIIGAVASSNSWDDFETKLADIRKAIRETNKAMGGEGGKDGTPKTTKEYVSSIASAVTEIEKMQSVIDSIRADGTFDMGDLLDLAETHPE